MSVIPKHEWPYFCLCPGTIPALETGHHAAAAAAVVPIEVFFLIHTFSTVSKKRIAKT